MNKTIWIIAACTLTCLLAGCETMAEVLNSNTVFEKAETKYEVHGCSLSDAREFECDVSISNFNRDKTIHVQSIKFRDDVGNEYMAPNSPAYGNRLYYAGEVFRHKIRALNVSTQATAVTALVVVIDIRGGQNATFRGEFILSGMETRRKPAAVAGPVPVSVPRPDSGPIECNSQRSSGDTSGLVNLALNGSATQSSTGRFSWDAVAGLANDGNTNGDYSGHSVAHTLQEKGAWWEVDLGEDHPIEKIVIWNRTDGGWGKRLTDFKVTVTDDAMRPIFTRSYCDGGRSVSPAIVVEIPNGSNGRFVKVSLNGMNYLQLAEVEVFRKVAAPKTMSLAGCWNWSNGVRVVLTDEGGANNGFATGAWTWTGDKQISISWPPITGAITLSADGKSLSATDSLSIQTTAQRIQGDPGGFVGVWQWSNGGVVTVAVDGAMTVGHLHGTWTGAGRNYSIAWPLIDEISVGADANSLSGDNQFGSFTASKQANCG